MIPTPSPAAAGASPGASGRVGPSISLERRVPPFGGFNLTYLRIELMRKLRNRRSMVFTVAFPILMYVIVGARFVHTQLTAVPISQGGPSVAAYIMVSMAMYGAMMSATQTGAAVAIERTQGWSRQLRLTPLNPLVNVIIKMIAGMVLGLLAVIATYVAAAISGAHLTLLQWIATGLIAWILAGAVFTTLGLMIGYMVPGENAAQITSLVIVILSFLGGLFYPLSQMPEFLQTIAKFTPVYGISQMARAPLTGDAFDIWALVNALVWFAIFVAGTVFFFRRDTKRV